MIIDTNHYQINIKISYFNVNIFINSSSPLNVTFLNPGIYNIKLIVRINSMANSTLDCRSDSTNVAVCINPTPTVSLLLDKNSGCAPVNVIGTGSSNIIVCGVNSYKWTVSYTPTTGCNIISPPYTYVNNTSDTSQIPNFNFTSPGKFVIG